jgi:hypothetical protein
VPRENNNSNNISKPCKGQQQSPLLALLCKDTIACILSLVHKDGYEAQVPLVCIFFRALSSSHRCFSLKRAKEVALYLSMPRRRLPEFIVSAAITIHAHQNEGWDLEQATQALASILYHCFPCRDNIILLLNALEKEKRIPEHLLPWENQIDMGIYRRIAAWLCHSNMKESTSRFRQPASWHSLERLLDQNGPNF